MGNRISGYYSPDERMGSTQVTQPKRRKIDKNNILNNRRLFYIKRYSNRREGSHFETSSTKLICNPKEWHNFYLMMGGVLQLPVHNLTQNIKECDLFGGYVFIEGSDPTLRTFLYTRKSGLPFGKSVSCKGKVNCVIPRYDHISGQVVIGMTIISTHTDSNRQWTRYDEPKHKSENKGFFEMTRLSDINALVKFEGQRNDLFAIYVGNKTSLLMVDTTESHPNDKNDHNVYTVFQEGAVLAFNCKLYFRFCDTQEDRVYDSESLLLEKNQLMKSSKMHPLNRNQSDMSLNRVFLLSFAPNNTFWTLKVGPISDGFPLECHLFIPSGGRFEKILEWETGLKVINGRQNQKPWNKFMEHLVVGGGHGLPLTIKKKDCYPISKYNDSSDDSDEDSDQFFGPYV